MTIKRRVRKGKFLILAYLVPDEKAHPRVYQVVWAVGDQEAGLAGRLQVGEVLVKRVAVVKEPAGILKFDNSKQWDRPNAKGLN